MTGISKLLFLTTLVAAGASAGAQGTTKTPSIAKKPAATSTSADYRKDLPAALVREAKITEAAASVVALAKVPKGKISGVELEREGGKLLYSYDIKVPGKSGIDEVQVDAMTGEVVGSVVHESPATERKEAGDEARETKTAKKPAVTKKPPV